MFKVSVKIHVTQARSMSNMTKIHQHQTGSIDVVKDCLSCFAIDLPSCICKKRQDKFILRYNSTVNCFFVNSALICNIQLSSRIVKFSLFFKLLYLFGLLFLLPVW